MQQINSKPEIGREIDLARLGKIFARRAWAIASVAVALAVVFYIYSAAFVAPTYRSYFTAYVNNRLTVESGTYTSTGDLTASMGLVYVYQDIMTSRSVLEPAAEACGTTYAKIYGSVTASVSDTAPVVTVVVETRNPKLSLELAQKIAELAPDKVAQVVEGSSMRIIDAPVAPRGKSSPNNTRYSLVGFLAGLALSTVTLVAVDLIYDKVQSDEDVEHRYSVPVIGHIPDMFQAEKSDDRYGYKRGGPVRR